MARKFYAIKEGFDSVNNSKVENKIVNTWGECLSYVKGVKGAKYKSFESLEDAKEYLNDDKKLLKKGVDSYPEDWLHVYVDGSFNVSTEKFSYGLVAVKLDVILYIENGSAEDNSQKQLRQISGELKAATKALEYAISQNEKKIVIFHDYEGIFHHAVGTWERKDDSSKRYYEFMNSMIQKYNLEIVFVKIDSHTGDIYNEIADSFAKLSAGMAMTGAVDKWLSNNILKVANEEIELDVQRITSSKVYENIVVKNETFSKQSMSEVKIEKIVEELNCIGASDEDRLSRYLAGLEVDVKDKLIIELLRHK